MSKYSKGANFERYVRQHLRNQGYVVFRSAGSHSPADLIAAKGGEWLLIQCKVDGNFPSKQRDILKLLGEELQCRVGLAYKGEDKNLVLELF